MKVRGKRKVSFFHVLICGLSPEGGAAHIQGGTSASNNLIKKTFQRSVQQFVFRLTLDPIELIIKVSYDRNLTSNIWSGKWGSGEVTGEESRASDR